jgi:hypothetical protein
MVLKSERKYYRIVNLKMGQTSSSSLSKNVIENMAKEAWEAVDTIKTVETYLDQITGLCDEKLAIQANLAIIEDSIKKSKPELIRYVAIRGRIKSHHVKDLVILAAKIGNVESISAIFEAWPTLEHDSKCIYSAIAAGAIEGKIHNLRNLASRLNPKNKHSSDWILEAETQFGILAHTYEPFIKACQQENYSILRELRFLVPVESAYPALSVTVVSNFVSPPTTFITPADQEEINWWKVVAKQYEEEGRQELNSSEEQSHKIFSRSCKNRRNAVLYKFKHSKSIATVEPAE